MPDLPEGRVVHLTPHRVRVRVLAKRHDGHFFSAMRQRLEQRPAVRSVEVNPATASILIHSSDSQALLRALEQEGVPIVEEFRESQRSSLEEVRAQLIEWNKSLQQWTGSRNDARAYIFIALVLSAIYQISRGDIFAPAATLLWYAGEALRLWVPGAKDESNGEAAIEEIGSSG
jgi:hypothetical protein